KSLRITVFVQRVHFKRIFKKRESSGRPRAIALKRAPTGYPGPPQGSAAPRLLPFFSFRAAAKVVSPPFSGPSFLALLQTNPHFRRRRLDRCRSGTVSRIFGVLLDDFGTQEISQLAVVKLTGQLAN
ncbi:MAG: hypothetical protein AAGH67_10770, partial [Cyanobacteria bacterium P01_H01_bin.162]